MPQIPGARFVFSFRIAADISSAVGGVESIEGSGVALAASAMRTGSSGGEPSNKFQLACLRAYMYWGITMYKHVVDTYSIEGHTPFSMQMAKAVQLR